VAVEEDVAAHERPGLIEELLAPCAHERIDLGLGEAAHAEGLGERGVEPVAVERALALGDRGELLALGPRHDPAAATSRVEDHRRRHATHAQGRALVLHRERERRERQCTSVEEQAGHRRADLETRGVARRVLAQLRALTDGIRSEIAGCARRPVDLLGTGADAHAPRNAAGSEHRRRPMLRHTPRAQPRAYSQRERRRVRVHVHVDHRLVDEL
jgi:hypothetical protein